MASLYIISLRALPAKIITHNIGSVDSIGNVIFLAGEERYACSSATFMFHGVGFDVMQPMRFEEKLLQERLDGIRADQDKIGAVITDRTSLTKQEVRQVLPRGQDPRPKLRPQQRDH